MVHAVPMVGLRPTTEGLHIFYWDYNQFITRSGWSHALGDQMKFFEPPDEPQNEQSCEPSCESDFHLPIKDTFLNNRPSQFQLGQQNKTKMGQNIEEQIVWSITKMLTNIRQTNLCWQLFSVGSVQKA